MIFSLKILKIETQLQTNRKMANPWRKHQRKLIVWSDSYNEEKDSQDSW
jgi:hypothetical protein